jgi:flagellar protein FliS
MMTTPSSLTTTHPASSARAAATPASGPAPMAYGGAAAATLPQARYPEAALSGVLQYIGRARRAMARRDVMAAHDALIRAQQILTVLRGALNLELGGELALRLQALYTYLIGELGRANLQKDAALLEPLPAIVAPLRDAFAQAAARVLGGQAAMTQGGETP